MNNAIVFRFDASNKMGIGHAMRCLAVIDRLVKYQIKIIVSAHQLPSYIEDKLINNHVSINHQKSAIGSNGDLGELLTVVIQNSASTIVLDGYLFDESYRYQLKEKVNKVITFDDINPLSHLYCDLVINALITANSLGYEISSPKAQHLLGLRYSILRSEFLAIKRTPLLKRNGLLVNFGGSDVKQLTLPTIKLLAKNIAFLENAQVIVVTGGSCGAVDEIAKVCELLGFEHHYNTNEISSLMNRSALAICAPGSVVYELAYCQVPSVFLTVADNQMFSAQAQQQAGWCRVFDSSICDSLPLAVNEIINLWKNKTELEKMSKNAGKLIDGKGADRIACQMIKLNNAFTQKKITGDVNEK